MHPILADRRRLLLYLLAWFPVMSALLVALLVGGGLFSWTQAAVVVLPVDLAYAFMCLAAFYVCKTAPLASAGPLRIAVAQVGAGLISAWLWLLGAQVWAGFLTDNELVPSAAERYAKAEPIFFGRAFLVFLLASALHYLLVAFEASKQAETEALRFQVLSREAELRALRAQIHPHFLFNSLNSINALITVSPQEARRVCLLLADFLRRSLALGSRELVPVSEELALVEDLLSIEGVRFGARLRYESRVDEAARDCPVPPLLLQPLVENAVTHGISQCLEGGVIRLEVTHQGERLYMSIDNPRDPEATDRKGVGFGLQSVRRRLEALYGREASLRVHPDPSSFRVELELPATKSLPNEG